MVSRQQQLARSALSDTGSDYLNGALENDIDLLHGIAEVQITPIKPRNGLVAFASFVLDGNLYLSSIGIITRPQGGYRLVYPTKRVGGRDIDMFHPINKHFASAVEAVVIAKLEDVMSRTDDRYHSSNPE